MDELDAFLSGLGGENDSADDTAQAVGALREIVGALQQQRAALNPMANITKALKAAASKSIGSTPQRLQRVMAGIPQSSIAAAGNFDANINVSEEFRPDRIILNTASWALNVTNVRIGTKSLNVSSNPLSGECFARDSVGGYLQGYTAQGGVGFVISFTNPTAGAIVCAGGVIGPGTN